ncbi:histone deacetylase [Vulcanibacillus modesticaldus]|uniref:Acetoin utilization protein AcuC n=1 Tax=Vulcanibacillus modesticaldus TaxID=337097 RepID=A0A1D2YRY7_9BACI|nr:acetoin utilization protein AcuC [Vulcanibacillus modesticaldus]OEF95546.1 histone deacetylase [Vulcanibacillus modesticaldus]
MNSKAVFIYSNQFQNYKFGDDHPFNQLRIELTYDLLKKLGALAPSQIITPRFATDEELALIHDPKYINIIKQAGQGKIAEEVGLNYGIGTEDTPIFPNMHEASALTVGGTLKAVEMVMEGKVQHSLNLGGGLHHGFRARASGFCIYNDSSIAINYIIKKYHKRVLYIDTDAHHGDGVQWAFYDTDQVCTLSFHETGRYLFPGTGNVDERGSGKGFGYSFNIPLDPFTEDESYLKTYKTALQEIADYYKPDVIVTQNGVDSHYHDPLSHLYVTMKTYRYIPKLAHEIAHKYCDGKWIAVGGGGYDIWRVVPRAWTYIWLEMNDISYLGEGSLPIEWIEKWQDKSPVPLPKTWDDLPNLYPEIPRKKEIEEKNNLTLKKALAIIRNDSENIITIV